MSAPLAPPVTSWLAEFGRSFLWIGGLSLARNALALTPAIYVLEVNQFNIAGARQIVTLCLVIALACVAVAAFTMLDRMRRHRLHVLADELEDRMGAAHMRRALAPQTALGGRALPALVGRDLDFLHRLVRSDSVSALIDLPFAGLFLLVLAVLHWSLGLIGLLCAGLQVMWLVFESRAARRPGTQDTAILAHEFGGAISRHADCASTMGLGAGLTGRWQKLRAAVAADDDAAQQQAVRWKNAAPISRAMSQLAIFTAATILAQRHSVSVSVAFVSFLLLGEALKPMVAVTVAWRSWLVGVKAAARLRDDVQVASEGLGLQEARGELVLEGVAWTPPGALRPALRGITLKIEAGAVLAIIGPSAAGKSTLARVLCGALRPAQGAVRLDGIDLAAWSETQRGAAIGYLPQDVALFPGSIAENIARFGNASEFQIVAAARLAGVHEMIRHLPDSYRTVVDDQSGLLSAGQRQRVALARALLGDPPVLILDEPDASLDAEGEAALIGCMIEARRRRRTVVMITHNTGLVRVADFVATMVGGHVMKVQRTGDVLGRPAMLAATG